MSIKTLIELLMKANEYFWKRRQELLYWRGEVSMSEASIEVNGVPQLRIGANARGLTRYMEEKGWCP